MECLHCGRCCMELGQEIMIVDKDDVARWIREERWDILCYLDNCYELNLKENWKYNNCLELISEKGQCKDCTGGDIENPHEWSNRCVFLRKVKNKPYYKCRIQETKPNHCRAYSVGEWKNCASLTNFKK